MNLTTIMEKWDTVAYTLYNIVAGTTYLINFPKYRRYLKKNKEWKNKYQGDRCFIVLNGPSLKEHDLSKLKDEYVFAVNTMYLSDVVDVIHPNFYCWSDSKTFNADGVATIEELTKKCDYSQFFFNMKYLNISSVLPSNVHITYSKHMPHRKKVRNNLEGNSSNFMTVAFYAINIAMYMGFRDIYILGLDFTPGHFSHFSDKLGETSNPNDYEDKPTVCGLHWEYVAAQYQSFYIRAESERRNINIVNLNHNSHIRAFSFGNYDELFS